jgi:hypothetical protein
MYARFRDKGFEFFTVYVREPHPGEHYHEHRSSEQKVHYARDCRARDAIEMPLLVDDLSCTVHHAYGEMPNMVYVIDKPGKVVYKWMWTDHVEIETVLQNFVMAEEIASKGVRLLTSHSEKLSFVVGYRQDVSNKVLDRAGPKARQDLESAFGS